MSSSRISIPIKKLIPFLVSLITGIIVFIIGILLVNSNFLMDTIIYLLTKICILITRLLTLNFKGSELEKYDWFGHINYVRMFPLANVVYEILEFITPLINLSLRLGTLCMSITLGYWVHMETKAFITKSDFKWFK